MQIVVSPFQGLMYCELDFPGQSSAAPAAQRRPGLVCSGPFGANYPPVRSRRVPPLQFTALPFGADARKPRQGRNMDSPRRKNISHEDIVILPLVLCSPPTSVGGRRPRTLYLEPALAGLLEEFKSAAEAGCQLCSRRSGHQLKLLPNRKLFLCVSRFSRHCVTPCAIHTTRRSSAADRPGTDP